ncbi:MAG: hypothetical protein KDC28_09785 [Saprospiraceae bacterium]|nr:hypothetical protein [Saprospiraceae bacterium]MCB9318492.1 hypothetical protein [Lewinellaceae bacterium]
MKNWFKSIHLQDRRVKAIVWMAMVAVLIMLFSMGASYKNQQITQQLVIDLDESIKDDAITKEDIIRMIQESFSYDLTGSRISDIDLASIEAVIRQYDFVANAEVYVDAEQNIHVDVKARKPLVRVSDISGKQYFLDDTGMQIMADGDLKSRVIVMSGNVGPYNRNEEGQLESRLQRGLELVRVINRDDFLKELIEQIYVQENGEITLIPKFGDERILLGMVENLDAKFSNLKDFYLGGLRYRGWSTNHEIDIRYNGQVITRKRA